MKKPWRVLLIAAGFALVLGGACSLIAPKREAAFDGSLDFDWCQQAIFKFRAHLLDDSHAQVAIARHEQFVNLDFEASEYWYARAARSHNPDALYALAAQQLKTGKALTSDERSKAMELMRAAAVAGSLEAKQYIEKVADKGQVLQ